MVDDAGGNERMSKFYVFADRVYCSSCLEKEGLPLERAFEIDGEELSDLTCFKCKDTPKGRKETSKRLEKGLGIVTQNKVIVLCPDCLTSVHKLVKGQSVSEFVPITDEVEVNAPVFCDNCHRPLEVRLSPQAYLALKKSMEVLESLLYDENLKTNRPALWKAAYLTKTKLDDVLLTVKEPGKGKDV